MLPNMPTNLADWYKWATKIHHEWQVWNCTITRSVGKSPAQKNGNGSQKFNFRPRPDPNAMDVNAMTVDKRTKLMRKGACFKCKEVGHLSQDCKKGSLRFVPQKKQGYKEAHTQIKALINTLDKEDQAKFYEEAQEEGF